MGAWKLRALVYGMLAVVAALVVLLRLEHDSAAEVPAADVLEGRTAQGGPVQVQLRDGELVSFRAEHVSAYCWNGETHTWTWQAAPSEPRVTYFQRRGAFDLHGRYTRFDLWVHARMSAGRVEGELDFTESYGRGTCRSRPVRFTASR